TRFRSRRCCLLRALLVRVRRLVANQQAAAVIRLRTAELSAAATVENGGAAMNRNRKRALTIGITTATLAVRGVFGATASSAPDKNTVKVQGGVGFAEFKGYESWQLVSLSQNGKLMAAILGNPTTIEAFQAGIPGNGKPFPDGSKMAKIHWVP